MLWVTVKESGYQHTHLLNWIYVKIIFVLFTFSVRVSNPWPNTFFECPNLSLSFFNCSCSQWMLKWSKRVSLRSVSSTNYPTSHHPQLSIFFTCLQILCITKYYYMQRTQNQTHTTFTHVLAYKTQKWSKIH